MNRNDFLNLIEDTVPFDRQMIGEVYELIDIFPYFQSAHMLLLKGLQDINDVKFENQLRNSAIHIADREMLYYFLRTKTSAGTAQIQNKQNVSQPDSTAFDNQQTVIESAKNSDLLIDELEKSSGEMKQSEKTDPDHHGQGHPILVSSESDNEESSGVMLIADDETSISENKIIFMDPGFSVGEHADLLELDAERSSSDFSDEGFPDHTEGDSTEKNHGKQWQSELINKFIIENPRIEPNREKSNQPVEDISKPFIEEEGSFVTETLAKIYINQGYYSKAIDIYEKLSLKFPEKSSYFASQIEKVKGYLK